MVRLSSWIAFCVCLTLLVGLLAGCTGVRARRAATPAATADMPAPPPDDERPPEAKAGEAWCRVWVPPVHEEVERRVLVRPAGKRMIREPAKYSTAPKLVCVAPAKLKETEKPAVWTTEKEDVLVREGRTLYRKVKCDNDPDGECYRLERCPPVFETRCKPVCVQPPRKVVQYSPAQYKLVEEKIEIEPATCRTECVPAEYEMRKETVCVQPGRWEWRRNETCEVPEPEPEPELTLPALEVEMVDSSETGKAEGVFEVGEIVRYDLTVRSDVGSEAFPKLKVLFLLPEQMEFVSGGGDGIAIAGAGRKATSSIFELKLEEEFTMHVLARVLSVPPTTFVQAIASVRMADTDEEVARETESTSLTTKGGK